MELVKELVKAADTQLNINRGGETPMFSLLVRAAYAISGMSGETEPRYMHAALRAAGFNK